MAWLGTYENRRKVTVDNTNIDSDLTHFPVPIVLGSSVGQSDQDVTDIFDEISYANRKKIAVTKSDGTSQIYAEIECWDNTAEKAVIWVSKSDLTLTASATTDLYLYYDSGQSDNTTYIGDTGDSQSQNVWKSDIVGSYLMAQDPSTMNLKDSTGNNDGTPNGSMTSADLVDGLIGKAIEFDGSDDWFDFGDISDMDGATTCTLEAMLKPDSVSSDTAIIRKWKAGQQSFNFSIGSVSGEITLGINDAAQSNILSKDSTDANLTTSTYYHIACVWSGTNSISIYVDGVLKTSTYSNNNSPAAIGNTTERFGIGARYHIGGTTDLFFDGILDHAVLYTSAMSAAWIKAKNYALRDDLLTFGDTEGSVTIEPEPLSLTAGMSAEIGIAVVSPTLSIDSELSVDNVVAGVSISPQPFSAELSMSCTAAIACSPPPLTVSARLTGSLGLAVESPTLSVVPGLSVSDVGKTTLDGSILRFFLTIGGIDFPMSSFQARRRSGEPTYLSAVIPTVEYADQITAMASEKLQIYQGYEKEGVVLLRELIIETDIDRVDTYEGGTNKSVVLTGYTTTTFSQKTVTLSGSTYRAVQNGVLTHRLAEPYIFLNPGDTLTIDSDTLEIDNMSYIVSPKSITVEVSSG